MRTITITTTKPYPDSVNTVRVDYSERVQKASKKSALFPLVSEVNGQPKIAEGCPLEEKAIPLLSYCEINASTTRITTYLNPMQRM